MHLLFHSDILKRKIHEQKVIQRNRWKFPYIFSQRETVNTAILEERDQSLVLSKQTDDPLKSCCTGRNRSRWTAACKLIHFVTYCAYYVLSTSHLTQTRNRNMKCYHTTTDRGLYPNFLIAAFLSVSTVNARDSPPWKNRRNDCLQVRQS